jgi:PAS domain S-box-containing protein
VISQSDILNARILIVDDKKANVALLEQMLSNAGYCSITSTTDPMAVLELYRKNHYDLVMLDLEMPLMSGFQLMEQLSEVETEGYLPVIVITAEPNYKIRALKTGAKDFVSKPFDLAEVLLRVSNMIEVRLLHLESKKLFDQLVDEKKTSDQLMRIFRCGPYAMSITNVDGTRIIDVNDQFCKFYGYSRQDIIGHSVLELHFWIDPEVRKRVVKQILQEGAVRNIETRHRTRSGEERDILASFELAEINGENELVLISIFIDITDRKRADNELRQTTARLNEAQEIANMGSFSFDVAGNVNTTSPQLEKIFGFSSDQEKNAEGWNALLHADDRTAMEAAVEGCLERGVPIDRTYRIIRHSDGQTRWLHLKAKAEKDSAGKAIRFAGVNIDITEQKHAAQEIMESEERFRHSFEYSAAGICISGMDFKFIRVNKSFREMTGYDEDELKNLSFNDITHPDDTMVGMANVKDILSGKIEKAVVEKRYVRKDGKIIYCVTSISLIRDENQKPQFFIAHIVDMTERNIASELLVKLNQAINTSGESIFMTNREGVFTFVNPGFCSMYGYTVAEIIGRVTPRILKSGLQRDEVYTALWKNLVSGNGSQGEYKNKRKDGSLIDVAGSANAIIDEKKIIIGFLGIQHDITDHKKIEESLKNSEEQFRLISENVTDMITVLDRNGKMVYTSPSYAALVGSSDEHHGMDFFHEIHAEDKAKTRQIFEKIVHLGMSQVAEYRLKDKHGTLHFIESVGSVILDDRKDVERIIVVSRDITEKKQNEKQLLRMQRMESVGTLAGGIAHDLNNILGPIILSLQILRKKYNDEKSISLLAMLEGSANRGAALVKQILTFARGTEGERMSVQIKYSIDELLKFIQETFLSDIIIKVDIPKDLWMINADPTQLHQILLNLVINARDAMPHGGTLSIGAENCMLDEQYAAMNQEARPGKYLMISISDSGTGIPPEIQEKIFEPFFTTKETGKGTGLGLATVLSIVKSHNGFMNLYSEMGKGTNFKIYFPAGIANDVKVQQQIPVEEWRGHGEYIMVVDDENTILEISKITLEVNGYNVLLAADGIEAISVFTQHREKIDLVITDMNMPNMDGLTLIRVLEKINPSLPIIGVSGLTEKVKLAEINELNIKCFLTKPYTAEKLLKTIGAVLSPAKNGLDIKNTVLEDHDAYVTV